MVSKINFSSSLMNALKISTSGMSIQKARMLLISQNLANAGSKSPAPGVTPYQRQQLSVKNYKDKNTGLEFVKVSKIFKDQTPGSMVYSPNDPAADGNGYVMESNVKPLIEITDLRESSSTHQANLKAYEKALSMLQETIGLLKV